MKNTNKHTYNSKDSCVEISTIFPQNLQEHGKGSVSYEYVRSWLCHDDQLSVSLNVKYTHTCIIIDSDTLSDTSNDMSIIILDITVPPCITPLV
jgi:hypothetical protein